MKTLITVNYTQHSPHTSQPPPSPSTLTVFPHKLHTLVHHERDVTPSQTTLQCHSVFQWTSKHSSTIALEGGKWQGRGRGGERGGEGRGRGGVEGRGGEREGRSRGEGREGRQSDFLTPVSTNNYVVIISCPKQYYNCRRDVLSSHQIPLSFITQYSTQHTLADTHTSTITSDPDMPQ